MEKLYELIKDYFPEFSMTLDDLKNPTPIFMRDFLCRVLFEFEGDVENIRKEQINQYDTHEIDILFELNLLTTIKHVFPFIKIGLMDLLNPQPRSTVKNLTAIMHFVQFADNCNLRLNTKTESYMRWAEQKQCMLRERQEIIERTNQLAMEIDLKLQEKQRFELRCSETREEDCMLQRELHNCEGEQAEIAAEAKKWDEQIKDLNEQFTNLSHEVQGLKTEIVDNPTVAQEDLDDKKALVQKLNEQKNELGKRVSDVQALRSQLLKLKDVVENRLLKDMFSLQALIKTACETREEVESLKAGSKDQLEKIQSVASQIELCEKNIAEYKSQIESLDSSHSLAKGKLEEDLANVLRVHDQERKRLAIADDEYISLKKELEEIEKRLQGYQDVYNKAMADFKKFKECFLVFREKEIREVFERINQNLP